MTDTLRLHITFLLILLLGGVTSTAQNEGAEADYTGSSVDNPIRINVDVASGRFEVTDSVHPFLWTLHKFHPAAIHYELNLQNDTYGFITTYGSVQKNTRVDVSTVVAAGDTIPVRCDTLGLDYVGYLQEVDAWDSPTCSSSQKGLFVRLRPGRYIVKVYGIYTEQEGTSNNPIYTTFLFRHPASPGKYQPVPHFLIKGTRENPDSLTVMSADRLNNVYRNKLITENYLGVRENFDGYIYYSFELTDTLDVTVSTEEYAANRVYVESMSRRPIEPDSRLYCPGGSSITRRLAPDKYLLSITDSASIAVGSVIGFHLKGTPPPPPPEWTTLMPYSPDVAGHNYIVRRSMLDATGTDAVETVVHYDGLGRESQKIIVGGSPDGSDIVAHTDYDLAGRQWRQWFPGNSTGGKTFTRQSDIDYSQAYGTERMPYMLTEYEPSALNRVHARFGGGYAAAEAGAAVRTVYPLNSAKAGDRCCFLYTVTDTPDAPSQPVTVNCLGEYPPAQLAIQRITDEDGNTAMMFSDAYGRKILERRIVEDGVYADTYYLYDNYGNLTVVLSPEASARMGCRGTWNSVASEELTTLAYIYRYDRRGRITSKCLPGCEPVEYVYDSTDRCVMWRDGNLRARGRWHFDIADVFGRHCLSGICSGFDFSSAENSMARASRSGNSNDANSATAMMGYVVEGIVLHGAEVLSATYHDDYSFIASGECPTGDVLGFNHRAGFDDRIDNVRGLATGTITAIPHSAGSDSLTYLYSAVYYDYRNRPIMTASTNHLGGVDREWTAYDFRGNVIKTRTEHNAGTLAQAANSLVLSETLRSYDRQGRLKEVRHRMDGDSGKWVRLHSYSYDAIGRLQEESLGEVDTRVYGYDVRSRLTSVEANLYRQRTDFTFGGNVRTFFWKTWENLSFGNTYRFTYDGLSRLVSARSSNEYYPSGRYDADYQYDLNGNITSLRRMGLYTRNPYKEEYDKYTEIDHVTMEYVGNQLSRATSSCSDPFFQGAMNFEDKADEEVEYVYDGNGNTVADLNRGTRTEYDWNNRPRRIDFTNGSSTAYIYDAAGVKRTTRHRIVSEWPAVPGAEPADPELFESSIDYCGPFIYEDSVLTRVNFEGGYISLMSEDGRPQREYHFFHRDHLGNNRVDVAGEGKLCQVAHYYPFGMQWGTGYRTDSQRWKFGGKELDRAAGLDLSDFEARQYDPTTGRFTSMDPHAEKYYPVSPYAYCMNNPLLFVDPTGENGICFIDKENKVITLTANYYVSTQNPPIIENKNYSFNAYSNDDIAEMKGYTSYLNNLGLRIESGKYMGYTMKFDLTFIAGGNTLECENKAANDEIDGINIGNIIRRAGEEAVPRRFGFKKKEKSDGSFTVVGGLTYENFYIIMNSPYDNKMNRIHEIFHTFGLKDGAIKGIMSYPPKTPNNNDAKMIMDANFLPVKPLKKN